VSELRLSCLMMAQPRLLFVTGKLAEPALRRLLADLGPRAGFDYQVAVLPITAVSLATTPWIARHLTPPTEIQRVVLPGLCAGDLGVLEQALHAPVERGPKDLRDLPEHFGLGALPAGSRLKDGPFDITIFAEINHAPRLGLEEVLRQARKLKSDGADV